MHIVISNTSDLPIYVQIKEQVKEQILSGELEEDEMLPSLRQLAKDLKISVLTTTRAYNELEEEGFITSRQGKWIGAKVGLFSTAPYGKERGWVDADWFRINK